MINRRNLGYLIALAALLISIPRYIATFEGIDSVAVTAWGMGILLAGGAAYIVDAWADASKRGIKRAWLLLIALGINLFYEPILLTPFVLSRLWDVPLASAMSKGYAVFWSVMVTLAPVLLVFGVVYAVWFHKQPTKKSDGKADKKRDTSKTSGQTAVELDGTDRAIMRTYRQTPAASYRTVAGVVGTGHTTVRDRVLNRLAPAGLVERTDDEWTVHWSDNGKDV